MAHAPDPLFGGPPNQGVSLDELARAFAQAIGDTEKAPSAEPEPSPEAIEQEPGRDTPAEGLGPPRQPEPSAPADETPPDADPCQISPRTIFEAMLFVGDQGNERLTCIRAAQLMRGVAPEEVPQLVEELNQRYQANGCPYKIISEGSGYRMRLRRAYHGLRARFFGRTREARLSQAALDVLAIVAYRQPITAERVSKLRDTPSNHVLAQLVRRRLLRIERLPGKRAARYYTTDRFLGLFGLASLADLPQTEEP